MKTKLVISSLVVSVAVALAAIIYIIVDKTSYCQAGTPNDYTAVSDEQTVVCLPGYVFEDGSSTHELKCDRPPYWNWADVPKCIPNPTDYCQGGTPNNFTAVSEDQIVVCLPGYVFEDGNSTHELECDEPPNWNWAVVPECIPKNETVDYCQGGTPNNFTAVSEDQIVVCLPGYVFEDGQETHELKCDQPPNWNWADVPQCFAKNETKGWKCPIVSDSTDLKGEILFVQPSPSEKVRIEGQISGLKKSTIQMIDVDVSEDSCYMTNDLGNSATDGSITIEGDVLRIQETIGKTMQINETFRFYVRAIGSQHVSQYSRADLFEGVVVFVLEQSQDTKGVYSASSTSTLKQSTF